MHITTKNGIGLTPNCCDNDKASGNDKAAAALLVISSVKMLVMINSAASITYGPWSCPSAMMCFAIKSATPEFTIALLMAKAQAMVTSISHDIYLVYFCGGNNLVQAIMTVVIETKKNISRCSPSGNMLLTAGSSPIVDPAIIRTNNTKANQRFFLPAGSLSFPLVNIKKTEDSPHVLMKLSSASTTRVSPSRNLKLLKLV